MSNLQEWKSDVRLVENYVHFFELCAQKNRIIETVLLSIQAYTAQNIKRNTS